ncbi:MAG: hypothetical protein CMK50_00155 [Propionibacteriaceae bacterium]|nr:hypothetical protein [Propionibacteriaceae bacterium]
MITSLKQLTHLRTAPHLSANERQELTIKLCVEMRASDWFTIGVMADTKALALGSYRALELSQGWEILPLVASTEDIGPVYLKANQKTGSLRIRTEHGLGSGILISGHGNDESQPSTMWGPFPLDFFF